MKRSFSLFLGVLLFLSSSLAPTGSAQSINPGTEIQVQLLDQLDTGKTQPGRNFGHSRRTCCFGQWDGLAEGHTGQRQSH